MLEVSTTFIAKGCERHGKVLDWSQKIDLIAFASAGDVCFASFEYIEEATKIIFTAAGHSKNIKSLRFISWSSYLNDFLQDIDYLVSCSIESEIIFWRIKKDYHENKLIVNLCKNFGKTSGRPVTCCTSLYYSHHDKYYSLIAFTSSFAAVNLIWNTMDGEIVHECSSENVVISKENILILSIDLIEICKGSLLLAVGTSDGTVQLLSADLDHKIFERAVVLRGFSDWITSLCFKTVNNSTLLATANQQDVVKLWNLSCIEMTERSVYDNQNSYFIQYVKKNDSDEKKRMIKVNLEAVMNTGDNWIKALHWHPFKNQLLCSSFDNGLIIFECSEDTGSIWLDKVRLENAIGERSGLFEARFSPYGMHIIANSYSGGFYAWTIEENFDDDYETWLPVASFGGHFDAVTDLVWDPTGSYLLSCSLDETTRCFAPYNEKKIFGEIARPQVHGYALNCITSISASCFVSGADEKKLRCFLAPELFAKSISNISGYDQDELFSMQPNLSKHGASIPALGLSNKEMNDAINESEMSNNSMTNDDAPVAWNPMELTDLPSEDHLLKNTLWPEVHKLYGHAFEIYAVASNHTGTLVASSCKASQKEHACIWLWDTKNWNRCKDLVYHNLTVVQIEFSHNDRYLLTVSRDRRFAIFANDSLSQDAYDWKPLTFSHSSNEKIHSRIIWSCSWSSDDKYFATASRDAKVCIWTITDEAQISLQAQLKKSIAITSVDFCPMVHNSYIFAIGFENGQIEIISWSSTTNEFATLHLMDQSMAHSQSVKRLRFRSRCGPWSRTMKLSDLEDENIYELASCGQDHAVKVYQLSFHR